jgi:hypothetical protein
LLAAHLPCELLRRTATCSETFPTFYLFISLTALKSQNRGFTPIN